jgi:hypothetical protein
MTNGESDRIAVFSRAWSREAFALLLWIRPSVASAHLICTRVAALCAIRQL